MMGTNNGRGEQVSVSVEGPERSGGPSTAASRPDPEVPEKAKRRQFSAEYKLGILKEADGCQEGRARSQRCCAARGCIPRT